MVKSTSLKPAPIGCNTIYKYPIILTNLCETLVILFTAKTTGTVVSSKPNTPWLVGDYSTDWNNSDNYWVPYTGKITLENE